MHILGTAVLFGYISGSKAILASPLLAIFGWFFIIPEIIGVSIQWSIYQPHHNDSQSRFSKFFFLSAIVGGLIVGALTPKEDGSWSKYFTAGLLAGATAASFSFTCIHFIKLSEHKPKKENKSQ